MELKLGHSHWIPELVFPPQGILPKGRRETCPPEVPWQMTTGVEQPLIPSNFVNSSFASVETALGPGLKGPSFEI